MAKKKKSNGKSKKGGNSNKSTRPTKPIAPPIAPPVASTSRRTGKPQGNGFKILASIAAILVMSLIVAAC